MINRTRFVVAHVAQDDDHPIVAVVCIDDTERGIGPLLPEGCLDLLYGGGDAFVRRWRLDRIGDCRSGDGYSGAGCGGMAKEDATGDAHAMPPS